MKKLGVVLTNRNTLDYLKLAIKSLRTNNKDVDFDLYIEDDGSTDGSKKWLNANRLKYNFSYNTHDDKKRRGIVDIVSKAVSSAKNEILFVGHSDMYYGKECLKNVLKYVKPKHIVCSTRIEPPIYKHENCKIQKSFGVTAANFKEKEFNDLVEVYLKSNKGINTNGMFAPTMFLKEDWIGYDQEFAPQSREDSDMFFTWKEKGYNFVQSWDSIVYHFSGKGSRRKDEENKDTSEWHTTEAKNLKNFVRKWGATPIHTLYLHPLIAPKINLSCVILLGNEEDFIYNLLDNVECFFEDIVIVNDNSKDNSLQEIQRYLTDNVQYKYFDKDKIKVFNYKEVGGKDYSKLRNFGVSKAKNDWIFHADCDEKFSPMLLNELRFAAEQSNSQNIDIFGFPRLNTLDGKRTDVWPDYQFRFHHKDIRWVNKVHEVPEPISKCGGNLKKAKATIISKPIEHHKTTKRQIGQNRYYRDITGNKIKNILVDSVIYTNEGITKHIREEVKEFKNRDYKVQLMDLYRGNKFGSFLKDCYEPIDITKNNYITLCNQPPIRWDKSLGLANFIGYFAFEGKVPGAYIPYMNHKGVKEIWTPSKYCRDCFIESKVTKPIKVIPHGIDPKVWKKQKVDIEKDAPFAFLGAGTWHNKRKGLDILIRAFTKEFKKEDNVMLVLKLNDIYNKGFDYEKEISKNVVNGGNENIFVVKDFLEEKELVELFNKVDCFVSPHRSEGFGMFILQAMAAELKVIATGATGNMDFCLDKNNKALVELINVTTEPYIPKGLGVYENAKWATPDEDHLTSLMRRTFEGRYNFDIKKVSKYIRKEYSWSKTVDKMINEMGKF